MKFAVTIISPLGYLPSETFREVAQVVHEGLLALGHDAILTTRTDIPDRRHIIFGANLLSRYPQTLAPDSILYNLEQVEMGSTWFDDKLLDLFRRYAVWDYSLSNVATLKTFDIEAVHVPIGYMPCLTRIAEAEKDIDVLFFGSLNERRNRILDQLTIHGCRVKVVSGVYGDERDRLIAQSKIVLNMHFYESMIFEIVRVSYLLANRVFVVSESGNDRDEDHFTNGLAFSNYENLVGTCIRFLAQTEERRKRIAQVGFALMALRDEKEFLEAALATTPVRGVKIASIKVNVGSGGRPMLGYLNTDVIAHPGVDLICPSWDLDIADASVEELRSHDVIEHLFPKDWPPTLNEFWRVIRPGGTIVLSVPDFGEVARGYTEGRYSINDARTFIMATVPPFNSVNYDVPESYHRTCHSKASLTADLTERGFVDITTWTEVYPWNLFIKATKPAAKTKPVLRICGMMRVKNEARWIAEAILSMKEVCNGGVFVLDDASTDDTATIAQAAGARVISSPFTTLNETRDKNFLLHIIKIEGNPDWVVCIDGDEVLEPSAAERILQSIRSGAADTYWLQALYMWDRVDQVRIDGVYREFVRPSLFNARKGNGVFKTTVNGNATSANLHCMNVPMDISDSRAPCAARFKHYGYLDREMRLKKYEYYNRIDPNNEIEDCYRHMVQGDLPEVPTDAVLAHSGPLTIVQYRED
jgi:hypothetical protein